MNVEMIKLSKKLVDVTKDWFDLLQDKNAIELSSSVKASDIFVWDFTDYIMYLIAADENINIGEVEVYRFLTGYGGDNLDSIKKNIEEGDVMSYDFQSKIPVSLQLLVNATNRVLQHGWDIDISSVLGGYVSAYVFAGQELLKSDGNVSYQERRDFELYVKNLIAYIEDRSYARFEKPLSNLLLN